MAEPMESPESGFFYDDKSPILVEKGADGIDGALGRDEELVLYPAETQVASPKGQEAARGELYTPIYVPQESSDRTSPLALARQTNGSTKKSTLSRGAVIEFILFGRSHRYFASDYPRYAPHFRDKLFLEARVLVRSIQGDQAIAYEFLEGDGSLGAWMSKGIRNAMDWWKSVSGTLESPPRPGEYDPLISKAFEQWDKLRKATADDYAVIHETGIEFMKIRHMQKGLTRRVQARIGGLIEAAETGQAGAEFVEEGAFKILDMYAQIRAGNSVGQLAAYRVGLMVIRAGARATGEWVADSSSRRILRATGEVVRKDFPPLAKDLFLSFTKKGFVDPKSLTRMEEFALQLLAVQVDFLFLVIDFSIYEEPNCPAGTSHRALTDKIVEWLPGALAGAFFSVLQAGLTDDPYKSGSWSASDASAAARLKTYKTLETVVCTLLTSAQREYKKAAETAATEKRPVTDVLLSDLGWILVRCTSDVGKKFVSKSVDKKIETWMTKRYESDKAAGRKLFSYEGSGLPSTEEIKTELRALVLAFQLDNAAGSFEPAKGVVIPSESKLPVPPRGPDAQGDVGMNKFASAPVIQPPNPPPNRGATAAKLKKSNREKVKVAKKLIPPQQGSKVRVLPKVPKDQADLKDIRTTFDVREPVVDKGYRVRRASGVLGEPGKVVHVRDESAQRNLPNKKSNQAAGHLIATEFGAPGDERNLGPQNAVSNSEGTYRDLEIRWGRALKQGKRVWVDVIDYEHLEGNKHRRVVKYRIGDEDELEVTFLNPAPVAPAGAASSGTLLGFGRTPQERDASLANARGASLRSSFMDTHAEDLGFTPLTGTKGVLGGKDVRVRTEYESREHCVMVARRGPESSGQVLLIAPVDKDLAVAHEMLSQKWGYLKDKLPRGGKSKISPRFELMFDPGEIPTENSNGFWVQEGILMKGGKAVKLHGQTIAVREAVR